MDLLVEEKRFRLVGGSQGDRRSAFVDDVRSGLSASPKAVPPYHLYDEEGSQLFDAICDQPEYYLTRTEAAILRSCAPELVERTGPHPELVELGSGSAEKTRILLRAFLSAHGRLRFLPIDIAREMLASSSRRLLADFEELEVEAIVGEYVEALRELVAQDQERDETSGERTSRLVLWLGSSVGNLTRADAASYLHRVHDILQPGDALLVGVDHRKDSAVLEAAYDDAQGISALFAKNLLVRINRELGGHFDLERFGYRATYDAHEGRVDMYIVSDEACSVEVDALSLCVDFEAGETIHTESSYKYSREEISELASQSGFHVERSWSDERDLFSLNLFVP